MEVIKAIKGRRSIRKYSNKPVNREDIKKILELAHWAPTPAHAENRFFIVIDEKEQIDNLYKLIPNRGAPVIIAVVTKKKWIDHKKIKLWCEEKNIPIEKNITKWETYWRLHESGAAIENLLLAAYDMGLATCWIGLFDEEKVKKLLGITEEYSVDSLVELGYAAETGRSARRDFSKLIRWEKWKH